jgi:thymidylate synthase
MSIIHSTTHQAYLGALSDVFNAYQYRSAPRGQAIKEIVNYSFTVTHPTSEPIITHDEERNKVIANYTKLECELYNSMTNRLEDFEKASSFWSKIANEDGTIVSAYGFLIWRNRSCPNGLTPWDWAKQSLIADKDTRQAILRFSLPEHQRIGVKDFPCTMYGNFLIRNDQLHLTIIMRSNDLVLGLVYDLPWFASLLDKMIAELKSTYPTLTKGTYTHIANSMHYYERDHDKVKKMLGYASV